MITRAMILAVAGLALAACTPTPTEETKHCPGGQGPQGKPKLIQINIVYTPKGINNPGTKCARPGDVLLFNLQGQPDKQASVSGKTDDDAWINGNGKIFKDKEKGWFVVLVPLNVIPNSMEQKEFSYTIMVDGSPALDPVVRIRHNY
jgi:hypothetical protein